MRVAINPEGGHLASQTEQGRRKRLSAAIDDADLAARGWQWYAPGRWRRQ